MSNVYVTLIGGVGNQLFQIAAGYAYAKIHNKNLLLDDSRWTGSQGNHPSTYKHNLYKNFVFSSHHIKTPTHISEKRYNYDPLPYEKGDVVLNGYFQSLKYFEDYADEFKALLNFDKFSESNLSNFGDMKVAAHVRRGDYLRHHEIHYLCDENYFNRAFSFFIDDTVDIYSDSLPDAMEELKYKRNLRFVSGGDEIRTLYMLSQYDSLIASNSSFSWWASFLGKKKDTIIVPDRWFKKFENHDDIYRTEFTRIPV